MEHLLFLFLLFVRPFFAIFQLKMNLNSVILRKRMKRKKEAVQIFQLL